MTYEVMPLGVLSEGDQMQASHYRQLDPVPRSTSQARRLVGSHTLGLPEDARVAAAGDQRAGAIVTCDRGGGGG